MDIATELRTAATWLGCKHSFPCQPPHGSLAFPGPCSNCGMPWGAQIEIAEPLRGPLVELLEEAAIEIDEAVHEEMYELSPGTYLSCDQCAHMFGDDTPGEDSCTCYSAVLAVFRAISGPAAAKRTSEQTMIH